MLDVDYDTLKNASNCLKASLEIMEGDFEALNIEIAENGFKKKVLEMKKLIILGMKKLIKDIDKRISYEERQMRQYYFSPRLKDKMSFKDIKRKT